MRVAGKAVAARARIDDENGKMQAVMKLSIFFDPAGTQEMATAQ